MDQTTASQALHRPSFSVRRYFSIASLIGIVIAALVFVYFFRYASMQNLVHGGEQENIAITRALVNNIWPGFEPFIKTASTLSAMELTENEVYQETYQNTLKSIRGLPILKIKIFDLQGKTVFSTDKSQLATQKPVDYPGSVSAKTGEIITKISFREKFKGIHGELTNRRIVSSYLPIYDQTNSIRGVFEVYYDVTDSYAQLERNQWVAFAGILATLSLLYLSLFLVSRKADQLIDRQAQDLNTYLETIENQNQQLEQRVQQRTEQLNKTVEELSDHKLHLEDLVQERTAEVTRAKDDAVQANQAKSIFLANMSHELRTPLNAILGYSEIMREEYAHQNHQINDDLNKIYVAGTHLLSIIDDILDISKIESGKMETYYENVNITEIINEVINSTQRLAQQNNNEIIVDYQTDLEEFTTDTTKFRQILYNLINNGNKFTKGGKITVSVSQNKFDDESWLKIVVSDTGIGMNTEQLDRIFQTFSQADSSTTREYGGTGLGLAICKGLCELLNGIISVESTPNKGSSFIVRLPTHTSHKAPQHNAEILQIGPKVNPCSIRFGDEEQDILKRRKKITTILAIDDDAEVRDLMERFLSRKGFYIHTAASADEGIEMAGRLKPDIIVTDIMMPIKDGITFMKEVKKLPELAQIPIIVVTIAGERETCMSLGAAGYLNKPLDWDVLLDIIRQTCRRVEAAKQQAQASA